MPIMPTTSNRFGPLSVAMAMAAGVAVAPPFDRVFDRLGTRLGIDLWLGWPGLGAPWFTWLFAAAIIATWATWRRHRAVVLAAGFALGAARGARPPIGLPAGVVADDRVVDQVTGIVHGPIVHGPHGDGAVLDTGEAAIWLWTDVHLVPGERLAATGLVHTPRGLHDPAVPDHADTVRARGAELELTARSLERLGDAAGLDPTGEAPRPAGRAVGVPTPHDFASLVDHAWRWADAAQARWSRAIDQAGGDPIGTAALRGITAGDRRGVPPELDQRWRAVGIYHVLSVSGLHLAVVAGLAFGLLRRIVAASPWGGRTRPARWAAPPALVLAIAYTLVTGAQIATLRALVVVVLTLVAQILDRPLRLADALGAAALAILAWRPADLWDPSFQLSFVAALTLALRPASEGAARGVRGWLVRGFTTSAWVALTTAPITAYQFHQVAAGGVLGNLVLTPVVELVALPLGLAGVLFGVPPAIAAASWIVGLADRGAGLLAELTPIGHVVIASVTTMILLVALSLWIATRTHLRARATAIAWLALCLGWILGRTPPPAGALRVTFLDVGQGDAALIELPDGAVWLVDAGGEPNARDLAQAQAPGRAIERVLAAYGHARIDLAILSHPHPDHYLGFAGIEAPIDELWTADERDGNGVRSRDPLMAPKHPPPVASPVPGFSAITAELAAHGTRLVHPSLGVARRAGGVELVVWAPRYQPTAEAPVGCAADPVRTINDNSLVISLGYRGRTILFAGDVEAEGEAVLVAAGLGHADVVKVPHHGSPTSSTARFVAATHPGLAVISCGRGNSFGFPSPDVVARWRAAGADIARTDTDGAITVTIDAGGALAIDRFAP